MVNHYKTSNQILDKHNKIKIFLDKISKIKINLDNKILISKTNSNNNNNNNKYFKINNKNKTMKIF